MKRKSPRSPKRAAKTTSSQQRYTVFGVVSDADGAPIAGLKAIAFDRDLRLEQKLAETVTDEHGRFELLYSAKDFCRAEKSGADLIVRVYAANARAGAKALATSLTSFNAPQRAEVNVTLAGASATLSHFEREMRTVQPLRAGQGAKRKDLALADLDAADIEFLSSETGLAPERVALLKSAAMLASQTRIECAAFYGWLRLGLLATVAALLERSTAERIAELERAIEGNLIPRDLARRLREIAAELDALRAATAVEPAKPDQPASLGDLLGTLPKGEALSKKQEFTFAKLRHEHGDGDALWRAAASAGLAAAVPALKRTLALGTLTDGHPELVRALHRKADAERPDRSDFVVALEPAEWIELVFEHGVPPASELMRDAYITRLQGAVEREFPARALGRQLEKTLAQSERIPTRKMLDFLVAHPDFDIRAQHIEPFLAKNDYADVELRDGLLRAQRLRAVTDDSRETALLLGAGFGSAAEIASEGQPALMLKTGGTISAERAEGIFLVARKVVATTSMLGSSYGSTSPQSSSASVIGRLNDPGSEVLQNYPSLATLFGDLDYCECTHCRSVLGPAAYFTDLMHFLQRSPLIPNAGGDLADSNLEIHAESFLEFAAGGTVLGALLQRRPDLADLELSCENTDTEIPHIDLVLEILENAVGLPLVVAPADYANVDVMAEFAAGRIPDVVLEALAKTGITIGKKLAFTEYEPLASLGASAVFNAWIIKDGSRRWFVRYLKSQLLCAVRSAASGQFVPTAAVVNPAAALAALEQGNLSAELEDSLGRGLPIAGQPRIDLQPRAGALLQVWAVSCKRAIAIKPDENAGTVEMFDLDRPDRPIRTYRGPRQTIRQIGTSFTAGVTAAINPNVAQLLKIPFDEPYLQEWNPNRQWWELSIENLAWVAHFGHLAVAALTFQNSSIRDDLEASPENRNPAAYRKLAENTVFPWALPFDLWLEETRAFLDALGLSRQALVEFGRPAQRLTEDTAKLELLGLSSAEADLLLRAPASLEPWKFWGLEEHNNALKDHVAGVERTGEWLAILVRLSMLLQQSGLSYREYLDFRQCAFAGPRVGVLVPPNECKTSNALLTGLSAAELTAHLQRIHVFTRLWRKVRWSMRALDRAITAFGGDITAALLRDLALLARLRAATDLAPLGLLGAIADLETERWIDYSGAEIAIERSFYDSIFQRASLKSLPHFEEFALDNLGVGALTLTERADYIASSLGVSANDVTAWVSGARNLRVDNVLSVASLSRLYAAASMCRVLEIAPATLPDVILLLGAGADLFRTLNTPAAPEERARIRVLAMFDFVERVAQARRARLDFRALGYLLRHEILAGATSEAATQVELQITRALTALLQSSQTGVVLGDESFDNLRRQLGRRGWYTALIDDALGPDALNHQLGASVEIHPAPAAPAVIPLDLQSRFTYERIDANTAILQCAGSLVDADFAALVATNLFPVTATDELRTQYGDRLQQRIDAVARLLQIIELEEIPTVVQPINFTAKPAIPEALAGRVSFALLTATTGTLSLTGWLSSTEAKALGDANPALVTDVGNLRARAETAIPAPAAATLAEAQRLLREVDSAERALSVLLRLVPHLEFELVAATLSAAVGLDQQLMRSVLEQGKVLGTGFAALMTDARFLRADRGIAVARADWPDQFAALETIGKIATVVNRFAIRPEDWAWLSGGAFSIVNLLELPNRVAMTVVAFDDWRRLVDLLRLRDVLPDGRDRIVAIAEALQGTMVATADIHREFAAAFALVAADVAAACGASLLDLSAAAANNDYADPTRLLELAQLLQVMQSLGTGATSIARLITLAPDQSVAQLARELFVAHNSGESLPARLRPICDRLRKLQRDALVAYLIHRDGLEDADALFDRYLIDVQMDSCMLTSRIAHAIASVQLFIQRCLLNLERPTSASGTGVRPDSIDAERWRWMQFYRVWEANRRVFLYPENWIEPSLRDDKSEIFRALESELGQAELTHDTATQAFGRYLERLLEISHLSVVSLCEEPDGQKRIVHVLARTEGQPPRYFYRRWTITASGAMWWSAWQETQLSPASEHLTLLTHRGKLYLTWLNLQKPGQDQNGKDIDWQVDVQLMRRNDEGWAAVSKSRAPISHPVLPGKDERTTFALTAGGSDDQISIQCWGGTTLADPALNPQPTALNSTVTNRTNQSFVSVRAGGKVWQKNSATPPRYRTVPGARVELRIGTDIVVAALADAAGNFNVASQRSPGSFVARQIVLHADSGSLSKNETLLVAANSGADLHTVVCTGDIVLDPAKDFTELAAASDPERPLRMALIGRFSWREGGTLETLPGDPGSIITSGVNAEHFASGFRERTKRPTDGLFLPPADTAVLSTTTPGRYFAVHCGRRHAYRDAAKQIYVSSNYPDPKYTVLQDGQDFVSAISVELARSGIEGAFRKAAEILPVDTQIDPLKTTSSSKLVREIDYERNAPYGLYNWEALFHIPLLIATQLSGAQRFEEAQRWFHLMFDPTSNDPAPEAIRYWRFKPFRDSDQPIELLLEELARGDFSLKDSIEEWAENPFRPHLIARQRIRSYKFAVVLKYLQHLIAWGDQQFRRDTRESLNQATQLYVLAARILGRRPGGSPKSASRPKSYRDIQTRLDTFSNAWVPWEGWLATQSSSFYSAEKSVGFNLNYEQLFSLGSLYFCIPANDKLGEDWDTIEDRLFKIRHCRNIDGIERHLPLFAPPIDPALLVRATALGLDLGAVLLELDASLPLYRFDVMLQKALEICAEVKALGNALLTALDKQDAEQLSLLRSGLEIDMLRLIKDIRQKQRDEAIANVAALRNSRESAVQRYLHFQRLMGKTGIAAPAEGTVIAMEPSILRPDPANATGGGEGHGLGLTPAETGQMSNLNTANILSQMSGGYATAAGLLHVLPDLTASVSVGVISASTTGGGSHLGSATGAVATALDTASKEFAFRAGKSEAIGGYQRRYDEWCFQSNLAAKELEQIDQQVAAVEIRKAIADAELANHQREIADAERVDHFMRDKYTSRELYFWLSGQVSGVYFRSYQLAHTVAKQAERAYRFELGLTDSAFIDDGYWDNLKKGLMAGERLYFDLKRMDSAYLDQNRREYELTKHVSLLSLNPAGLIELRQTGRCEFEIPEISYDLDCPGHFMRRIKSVSLTIPCVTGPYTSVNCTVTLLKNSVRRTSSAASAYMRLDEGSKSDARFKDDFRAIQAMVTSTAQNDAGLFEINLRDDRYLPFEGAGAISRWRLELPGEYRAFDYCTIADAVLHVRYTAREGGDSLKAAAQNNVRAALNAVARASNGRGLARVFSLRHDFPTEWYRLTNPPENLDEVSVDLPISKSRFPFLFNGQRVKLAVTAVNAYSVAVAGQATAPFPEFLDLFAPGANTAFDWAPAEPIGTLPGKTIDANVVVAQEDRDGIWQLAVASDDVAELKDKTADLLLVFRYELV